MIIVRAACRLLPCENKWKSFFTELISSNFHHSLSDLCVRKMFSNLRIGPLHFFSKIKPKNVIVLVVCNCKLFSLNCTKFQKFYLFLLISKLLFVNLLNWMSSGWNYKQTDTGLLGRRKVAHYSYYGVLARGKANIVLNYAVFTSLSCILCVDRKYRFHRPP